VLKSSFRPAPFPRAPGASDFVLSAASFFQA